MFRDRNTKFRDRNTMFRDWNMMFQGWNTLFQGWNMKFHARPRAVPRRKESLSAPGKEFSRRDAAVPG